MITQNHVVIIISIGVMRKGLGKCPVYTPYYLTGLLVLSDLPKTRQTERRMLCVGIGTETALALITAVSLPVVYICCKDGGCG